MLDKEKGTRYDYDNSGDEYDKLNRLTRENNERLGARILKVMSAEDRGKILGAMNSEVAAKITKIMDPES